MMYGYGNGIGGWGYALMAIGMILFWGAVIYGTVALVRYTRRDGPQRGTRRTASTRTGAAACRAVRPWRDRRGRIPPAPHQPAGRGRGSRTVTAAHPRSCPQLRHERPGPGNGRRLLLVTITVTLVSCAALALTLGASLPAGIPPGGHHEDGPGVRA